MASSSGSASANKETNVNNMSLCSRNSNFEDPLVEFMYEKMIRECITGCIGSLSGGKVKLGGKNVQSFNMSMKLLETHPFDTGLVQGVIHTILESKKNKEKGQGPVSFWVLEEFDVIQKEGKDTLIIKPRPAHPAAREVIACNETFNIIKEAHLKNNHAGFEDLKKILMTKYFFHTICILSFLKLCSVCNKDPNKMKSVTETYTAQINNYIQESNDCNEQPLDIEDYIKETTIVEKRDHNNEMTIVKKTDHINETTVVKKRPKTYAHRKVASVGQKQMPYSHKYVALNELLSKPQSSFVPVLTLDTSSVVADSDVDWSIENSESFPQSNATTQIESTPSITVATAAPSLATLPKVPIQILPKVANVNSQLLIPKTSTVSKIIFTATNTDTSSCFNHFKITPKPAMFSNIATSTNTVTSSSFSTFKITPAASPSPKVAVVKIDKTRKGPLLTKAPQAMAPKVVSAPNVTTEKPFSFMPKIAKAPTQRMLKLKQALNILPEPKKKKQIVIPAAIPNHTRNSDKFKHCRAELIPIHETNDAETSEYKAILLYMDNVSKYTLLRPLRSHSIDELTVELYKVFADFNTPEVINTHLYQKPLFNAVLQRMKQPPVNAKYLVESPKHMSNIVQEQVSLLIQKWKAITNCDDWLLGCLEIQKQLNSYRDKDLKHMSNPFYLVFSTKNAPFINYNKHFDLGSVVEAEENGDVTNKSFITLKTYTQNANADSIVIDNIDLSSSSTDNMNEEDNDQVTVIEPEYEQILGDFEAFNASRDEEDNNYEIKIEETELEADKNETEHNVNAMWPLPMKTETYSFQIEDESESSESSSNPQPSVPVGPFAFVDEGPESSPKRVKLETVCHECGKEAERPVPCVSCSRPVHFNLDCASELDIDEDDNKLKYAKCKTCAKIESKVSTIKDQNQCQCQ